MRITILAFGIIREIVGGRQVELDMAGGTTIADLHHVLISKFPSLAELSSMMVAIHDEYAADSDLIGEGDEIALIPPVSGG